MVATSATRDARNRDDFFGMVRDTLGVEAEVISGDEEAQLSFTGAVGDLDPDDGPFVVVDIGGGSTELVVGTLEVDEAAVRAARSVDIGSVRITERCLHGDPPSADEVAQARELATSILDEAFAAVPELRDARKRLLVGDPATTLVRASRKARMVLAGPRGRDRAALLGPVAQELLRRGACPTLFVHGTMSPRH
jgi:exopolyphosphatase/guanosine-5'-triphosphate,3'-diphosphate pyrophosphatase